MIRDFIAIDFETANHQLHTVAAACGYDLQNHHHALADAEACAAIALYILEGLSFNSSCIG